MKVVEEFMTIQGEGRYIGRPSYFIRTTGCNLRCAWKNPDGTVTQCDTPYTSWFPEKGWDLDVDGVLEKLSQSATKHIVITGGEPTLQKDLADVANAFSYAGYRVTIETNGTAFIGGMPHAFMSISPKTRSSYAQPKGSIQGKLHEQNNEFLIACKQWVKTNDYQLKFVYNERGDLEDILNIQSILNVPSDRIFLMPQGITTEQFQSKQKELFEICQEYGFNYAPRMHIDIFGNKRGI